MSSLPVLMYHNVTANQSASKGLTISVDKLEEQFQYLVSNKYNTYHLSELKNLLTISNKSVILTFDDVTKNQMDFAIPLLSKYGLKATFFVPFKYIGGFDAWNTNKEEIMTIAELKNIPDNIELGYHSFAHDNFANMSIKETQEDFKASEEIILKNDLKICKSIAYPYGKYPRKDKEKQACFFEVLKENNMHFAFRIGNRVNKFPFKNNFEIQRIDIKGDDSLLKFKLKLKFGKISLF